MESRRPIPWRFGISDSEGFLQARDYAGYSLLPTGLPVAQRYKSAVDTDELYLTDGVLWLLATLAAFVVVGTAMVAANLIGFA